MTDELKNILERVRCLYMKFGIKSVTMDDVSRELGISKKTLYQYVTDRADLVSKVLDYEMDMQICEMHNLHNKGSNAIAEMIEMQKHVLNNLKGYNPAREYDLRKYYPELYQKYISEHRSRMIANITNNIERGKAEGIYRQEVISEMVAKILALRVEMVTENDEFNLSEYLMPQFFNEIMRYHIRGLANDKGNAILDELIS